MEHGPWAIDEFARIGGTTVRNVRLYQERGLLPPPNRSVRRAMYSDEHLRRLRLVLALIKRGYPLAAIRELVDAWVTNRSLGDVLGFEEALAQPFAAERPRRFTLDQLQRLFADDDGSGLARSIELGILTPDGDGFIAPLPSLLDVGAELVEAGVPLHTILDASAEIRAASEQLGRVFVKLFVDSVWEPFVAAGQPADGWTRVTETLNMQREIWPRAVLPALAHAIEEQVAAAAKTLAADVVSAGPSETA